MGSDNKSVNLHNKNVISRIAVIKSQSREYSAGIPALLMIEEGHVCALLNSVIANEKRHQSHCCPQAQ